MVSLRSKYAAVDRVLRRIFRRTRKWLRRRPTYIRELFRSIPQFSRGHFSDLAKAPPAAKRIIVRKIPRGRSLPWEVSLPSPDQVEHDCRRVYEETGLWPLSYAYPSEAIATEDLPRQLISPVFPGHRYQYDDESTYREQYQSSAFAMTHRKAGWDCFRHVEIMHAGGIPFMPDAPWIPPGTMVHYPKEFFAQAVKRLMVSGDIPSWEVFTDLQQYFNRHLTTASMARYLMKAVGVEENSRVLVVDKAATEKPDYTSNLTAIGLKQVLGDQVVIAHPTDYLYRDWAGKAQRLYGRGFGYSRVLDPLLKSDPEKKGLTVSVDTVTPESWDWVVIGSVPRNPELTGEILGHFPPERTILLHGEDTPPSPDEARSLLETGAHVFVREISSQLYWDDRLTKPGVSVSVAQ